MYVVRCETTFAGVKEKKGSKKKKCRVRDNPKGLFAAQVLWGDNVMTCLCPINISRDSGVDYSYCFNIPKQQDNLFFGLFLSKL